MPIISNTLNDKLAAAMYLPTYLDRALFTEYEDIIQTIDTEMNKMLILTSLLNCRLAIAQKYIFIINIKIMP